MVKRQSYVLQNTTQRTVVIIKPFGTDESVPYAHDWLISRILYLISYISYLISLQMPISPRPREPNRKRQKNVGGKRFPFFQAVL